ncbi:uncharacterized protein LOC117331474 [Pecten maximus]|uniref:uncharacterized protein LOC117331474 n=1 Tax=Pecten maximus TaxID=6579 RepID=UPI00145853B3|nr:uncharacterized protein LOC117331474 [Pecten maximus]
MKKGNSAYLFDVPKVIAYFHFSADPCTSVCNIETKWRPLKEYITIAEDENNFMLRLVPYALDQDMDTCFNLPVPGDSPSMLWLMIKNLTLFGVTSRKFAMHFSGEGIECTTVGQKSIQVGTSGPAISDQCAIESSDIAFCKVLQHNAGHSLTQCNIECECENFQQCSNVHIIMQSANRNKWRLCELTMDEEV